MDVDTPSVTGAPRVRVAFLEDCLFIRDALSQLVGAHGLELVGVDERAESFFETLRRTSPEVAVLDLFLQPGPQRLLERIRDFGPGGPRFMVFAARTDPDLLERAREAGVQAYLEKRTSTVSRFVETVRVVARGEQRFDTPLTQPLVTPPEDEARRQVSALSDREREVLGCLAAGWDNLKIAAMLGITERTVRAHITALYRKLDCENRSAMALLGYRMGLSRQAVSK